MPRSQQQQTGGDSATNVQAGRDVHIHGLTLADARAVAIDVFKANALELQGIAQITALARADEITREFLEKLYASNPALGNHLADPDVQNVLFQAQKEYARSGEEDLKRALIDLLAARATETTRDLRTIALNEAIVSAPKLTEIQRRALAWVFFLKHTRISSVETIDAYYETLNQVTTALGVEDSELW
jgi:hypothetical protein